MPWPLKMSLNVNTSSIETPFSNDIVYSSSIHGSHNSKCFIEETLFSMNPVDYEIGQVIGFGSSAIVYLTRYLPISDLKVAVKLIDLELFERNQIDELRKEIQVMKISRNSNLLPVLASFIHQSKLWIVMPFLSAGSCLDIIKYAFKDGFEEITIATILLQALQGLDYLHKNGQIHRDVKAGNLLMDGSTGVVKLADFGVSSSLSEEHHSRTNSLNDSNNSLNHRIETRSDDSNVEIVEISGKEKKTPKRKTFVGTPCWMAPEVMEMNGGYDQKADIWSFGITALELANGQAPYAKFPPMKVIYMTLSSDPPTLDRYRTKYRYSKYFKEMIDLCLQRDPSKRPSTELLMKQSFFKQAKKPSYLLETVISKISTVDIRNNFSIKNLHKSSQYLPPDELCNSPTEAEEMWDFPEESNSKEGINNTASRFTIEQIQDIQQSLNSENLIQEDHHQDSSGSLPAETRKGRFSVTESTSVQAQQQLDDSNFVGKNQIEAMEDGKKSRFEIIEEGKMRDNCISKRESPPLHHPRSNRATLSTGNYENSSFQSPPSHPLEYSNSVESNAQIFNRLSMWNDTARFDDYHTIDQILVLNDLQKQQLNDLRLKLASRSLYFEEENNKINSSRSTDPSLLLNKIETLTKEITTLRLENELLKSRLNSSSSSS